MLKLLQFPAMFDQMTAPQQSRWPRAPLPPGPKWTGGPGHWSQGRSEGQPVGKQFANLKIMVNNG